MDIVAIAAYTSGIAHTYIVKEELIRATEGMGHIIHMGAQGTTGTGDELIAEQIRAADVVILAIDIATIDAERPEGEKTIKVPTNVYMKAPKQLIQKIETELSRQRKGGKRIMKKFGAELRHHALTAISYMPPLAVASGLLIAIGNLTSGEVVTDLNKMAILSVLTSLGVLGMGLLSSFIAGYISYPIADRPGIAPGFLIGQITSSLGAGFLGGMVGDYIVGYIALFIRKHLKVPR